MSRNNLLNSLNQPIILEVFYVLANLSMRLYEKEQKLVLNMKRTCIFIFLIVPMVSLSQIWKFQKVGNSFDGFAKAAAVQIESIDDKQAMLAVLNTSNELKLVWGVNGKNGLNNLSVRILIPDDIKPDKILMAFDDENQYYLTNFSYSEKKVFVENACAPDYKVFFSLIDIISLFKSRNVVHFRILSQDQKFDFNFPLKGCTAAINQTFICPTYKRSGDWTDATFELMAFTLKFSEVDGGKKNFLSVAPNCIEYLQKNKGLYFFTQVKTIESSADSLYLLIFKNNNGEVVASVSKEVCLKNLFYFSGKPKVSSEEKKIKDLETLEIYFKAFQDYTNLITDKITFDQFSNLTKNDLMIFYKTLINNMKFLDYMRSDKSVYYHYEVNEYTFDVFIEPWGTVLTP